MTKFLTAALALFAATSSGCGLSHLRHQRDAYDVAITSEEKRLGIPSRDQSLAASIEKRYKAEVLALEADLSSLITIANSAQEEIARRNQAFEAKKLDEVEKAVKEIRDEGIKNAAKVAEEQIRASQIRLDEEQKFLASLTQEQRFQWAMHEKEIEGQLFAANVRIHKSQYFLATVLTDQGKMDEAIRRSHCGFRERKAAHVEEKYRGA